MLRSEVHWFSTFLRLCREKLLNISKVYTTEDNPLLPLLEGVLACDGYRQVVDLLQHHPWVDRQAIYELRTQARKKLSDVPRNISLQLSQSRSMVSRTLASRDRVSFKMSII